MQLQPDIDWDVHYGLRCQSPSARNSDRTPTYPSLVQWCQCSQSSFMVAEFPRREVAPKNQGGVLKMFKTYAQKLSCIISILVCFFQMSTPISLKGTGHRYDFSN